MKYLTFVLIFTASLFAQKPVAQLPNGISLVGGVYVGTVIDTTYALPVGGTTWAAHNVAQFKAALTGAVPGDVIVLDAGVTYTGNFTFPNKVNPSHKWIYIISSNLAAMPEGTGVSPADAANMPKIVTPGGTKPINVAFGANYWRMAGIEVYTASNYPPSCGVTGQPNCVSGQLIGVDWLPTYAVPDHVYIDRCYFHGDDTHNIVTAIQANWTWSAVVDSYVSAVHARGQDSQAVGAFNSTGPFKIVNNYLEAAGENIMFGGSGKNYNIGVPSDIEIRNNYIYKPLSWIDISLLPLSDPRQIVVKNAVECKSCQRYLLDSNVIENVWQASQTGYALQMTVRSYQSGDFTVLNDLTITNNILKNVVGFMNTLAADDLCLPTSSLPCNNAGSETRWNISNNLVMLMDPNAHGWGPVVAGPINYNGGYDHPNNQRGVAKDILFQHNTVISPPGTNCYFGAYFNVSGLSTPPPGGLTQNIWILDNVLCRQTIGSWGTGGTHTYDYMGIPNVPPYDLPARYSGNVMWKGPDAIATWPPKNLVTASWTFDVQNRLMTPDYTASTTDGIQAGYTGIGGSPVLLSISVTPVGPIILIGGTQQFTATGNYSNGSTSDLTTLATWASASTGIATIGASTGLATGVAQGTSVITATYTGVTGSTTLTVHF